MASRRDTIKGITVSIGGDTTQLGKALEAVNNKSQNLTEELKDIEKLLRFDPTNTELLAQRQKMLSQVVEATGEKLDQLREAERQVQEQFARGDATEAQLRALQREIISTEGQMRHYLEEAQKAGDGTKKLGKEAEETGGRFEGMREKLAHAAKVGIGAVIAGAGAAVTALVASAEATREYRTEMGKLTTAYEVVGHRTEMAEEAYKRLYGVIGETDQTVEAAQQIALLAESEEDVIQWADLGAGVVARFGDALQPETFFEAANETIKLGEATGAYVQLLEGAGYDVDKFNAGLAECTSASEKQAYMLSVTEELLGEAADMYRETNAEVIRANQANDEWIATMAEAGAAVEPILTDVKLLGASLLGELMPGVTGVTDAFRGLVNGEEGSAEAVGEALSGLLSDLLNMAMELLPTIVDASVSLLNSLITTIVGMLPQLVDVGVQIVMSLIDGLITAIPQFIEGALQLLLSIMDAITLLLPQLIEAVPQIVTAVVDGLVGAIPDLINGALDFLLAIVQAVPLLIDKLLPEIPRIVDTVIYGLLDCLPDLIDGAVELFFGILEALPEINAAIYEEMPTIIASIVSGLSDARKAIVKAGWQLIEGLIEGMINFDYFGAIKKIGDGIVSGFKKVFDIHSPSRIMAELGELLDEGLAVGIEDNANAPVNALDKLSNEMLDGADALNGVTLERRMTHAFEETPTATPADGINNKLDLIYKAILRGQVIMLDGKTLVGSTADRYDNELGQRRVLAERGAI